VKSSIERLLPVRTRIGFLVLAFLPFSALGQAPSIVMQSSSATVIAGQPASFSVGVGGSPTPSFQWQESMDGGSTWTSLADGNGFSGSEAPTLAIGASTAAMSGEQFRMVATNASGSATSVPVTLAVTPLPTGDAIAYDFATLAGFADKGGADGTGNAAEFNNPLGVAADGAGNVYVADTFNYTIRKITPLGVVTTLAGAASQGGSADGTGSAARFWYPNGVAVDSAGTVYVADSGNCTIRQITPAGVVTTLAGAAGQIGSADGTGSAARFNLPSGIAVDGAGNIYVGDTHNDTIRKITPAGVVTTLAGTAGQYGSADGTGSAATFWNPFGVAVDSAGNVYVADSGNNTIREVTPAGVVTTLFNVGGIFSVGNLGQSTGPLDGAPSVAVDSAGNIYVAGTPYDAVLKYTRAGVLTMQVGSGKFGYADGPASTAEFDIPAAVALDSAGNIIVADSLANTIRMVTPTGVVTTLAGAEPGSADGAGSDARFYLPIGLVMDSAGNVYVADTNNSTIRKITPAGVTTTLAGAAGQNGSADGTGSAARFSNPYGIAVDSTGNVYVADSNNSTIRKIAPGGVVTTLAGAAGQWGKADGTGSAARFSNPVGVAVDGFGNVYVADGPNNNIRKITPAGAVTTLAGGLNGSLDGTGNAAQFNYPSGVAVDCSGNIYVADTNNSTVREISPAGVVTTLAGAPGQTGSADGAGSAARFNYPNGIAVDSAGNVYVADTYNSTVREISPAGVVTTLAGTAGQNGSADGLGSTAQFNYPRGVAADNAGNVYVADSENFTIRMGKPTIVGSVPAAPEIVAQLAPQSVMAGGTAVLTVIATAYPEPTYQWQYDGVPILGATGSTLTLSNIGMTQAGAYSVVVTSGTNSVVSNAAMVTVSTGAWLTNLSARAYVAPSLNQADVLIAGFVTAGPDQKSVLVRGVGPGLGQFGLTGFLANPSVTIYSGSTAGPTLTGWSPNLAAVFKSLGAFSLIAGSEDTAVVEAFNPGPYTTVVSSADGKQSGIMLAELYDADQGAPTNRLINLSARAYVGSGANILIAGFVVSGNSSETLLIRAIGPGLIPFGVPGTLNSSLLQIYDSNPANNPNGPQVIASIQTWGGPPTPGPSTVVAGLQPATATIMTTVGAFNLPASSLDAAMVITLPPGAYTAQVQGADGGTGIALVEVYEVR